ncbi:MAG: hypothetical protein PHT69_10990 [Bacteroidales bacterium]|nr:hypothetical protein [Bacteroidales bacterium]
MSTKRIWEIKHVKQKKTKVNDTQKKEITAFFEPLIVHYMKHLQEVIPDKKYNYVVDIYTKWFQNYFYFCEKYKAEYANRIADDFERKFLRLEFVADNQFNLSYFRHTGQWYLVNENLSLETCLKMINENPLFQPLF